MIVSIITIGDELLIGQVVDTNSAWMADQLQEIGGEVKRILTISDSDEEIQNNVQDALSSSDVVLISGGLGPTKDDITKKALADFFGVEMVFSQETFDHIMEMAKKWDVKSDESIKRQSYMPANAQLLENQLGTAPGMWFEHEDKIIVSMPGVPYEMKYIMEHGALPKLAAAFPDIVVAKKTILTSGIGESVLANRISDIEENLPPNVKLAYLPSFSQVRLRLMARGSSKSDLEKIIEDQAAQIEENLGDFVFGHNQESLPFAIGQLLKKHQLSISTAESCTGGRVANLIISVPGSSAYFYGGILAYQNEIKHSQLNVSKDTLEKFGAVSEECVIEMAKGVIEKMGTNLAVSISGIAGPGGGSPQKPVGTVWVAVADNKGNIFAKKYNGSNDRSKNIEFSAYRALNQVRRFLIKYYGK